VVAICICTEQTFIEAAAHPGTFGAAFSAALDTYFGSTLQNAVNRAIAKLSPQDYKEVVDPHGGPSTRKVVSELVEIIKTHRLRIRPKQSSDHVK